MWRRGNRKSPDELDSALLSTSDRVHPRNLLRSAHSCPPRARLSAIPKALTYPRPTSSSIGPSSISTGLSSGSSTRDRLHRGVRTQIASVQSSNEPAEMATDEVRASRRWVGHARRRGPARGRGRLHRTDRRLRRRQAAALRRHPLPRERARQRGPRHRDRPRDRGRIPATSLIAATGYFSRFKTATALLPAETA